ncbi:FecR family protein [Pedobacter insulae]|uniref:FecR protein n=1 Tax=Pedobacter insulae TaxID=414048 RepID=A0A1I3ANQ5_9SPHI|nr:FecR family protein [Pedobacter insulae]SFH51768.1 FecR protein [Pedobacter insulae]
MKKDIQLKELYDKYTDGTASKEERLLLENWYNAVAAGKDEPISHEKLMAAKNNMWIGIQANVEPVTTKTAKLWYKLAAAASIVIVIGLGLYLYQPSRKTATTKVAYANDIAPGKSGATLTLANGQKILINDALTGNIANQSGVKISKTADGQIIYEIASSPRNGAVQYNTLSTTRGEQAQVRLPDGTLVFLNAESSLKYPTSFARLDKRQVALTGEGYFEVAKDKAHPFVVRTEKQLVEVLGTHFNVSSYHDGTAEKTTLLEGSVRVSSSGTKAKDFTLQPNQQAVLAGDSFSVINVVADDAVAWKNGLFIFDDESLASIMKRVERWYDVEVVYDSKIDKNKQYGGGVSRYDNVSKVLEKLTLTGNIHFKIEGRRITVME